MKIRSEWEEVNNSTNRLKVIGGWIVLNQSKWNSYSGSESMCFVPDPNHE